MALMSFHKALLMINCPFADSAGRDQSLAYCASLDWAIKVKNCGVPEICAASVLDDNTLDAREFCVALTCSTFMLPSFCICSAEGWAAIS